MRHKLHLQGVFSLMVLLIAATLAIGQTKSNYDKNFNFGLLHTWNFAPMGTRARDLAGNNPFWATSLRENFSAELAAKGFPASSDTPDFLLSFRLGTRTRERIEVIPDMFPGFRNYRSGWVYWNSPWNHRDVYRVPYDEATLIVDIVETRSNRLVWRGYDRRTIDLDRSEKTLRKAVEKLIDRFVADRDKVVKNLRKRAA